MNMICGLLAIGIMSASAAPLYAAHSKALTLDDTNVSYDLKALYGKDSASFALESLLPQDGSNFRFLCFRPAKTSLYVYLYHDDSLGAAVSGADFSMGELQGSAIKQNADSSFPVAWKDCGATFVNSYGTTGRFMKFRIDGVYDSAQDSYFTFRSASITYASSVAGPLAVNAECGFKAGEDGQFIYDYFGDSYVTITSGEVGIYLVAKDRVNSDDSMYHSYDENFYYFFDADTVIDELESVTCEYIYETYDCTYKFADEWICTNGTDSGQAWKGLEAEKGEGKTTSLVSSVVKTETVASGKKTVKTVERPKFLLWSTYPTYEVDSVIKTADSDNISDASLREFVAKHDDHAYGVLLKQDLRATKKTWTSAEWYTWVTLGMAGMKAWSTTECHEVKQAVITRLKFYTDSQEFDLNALDVPKDTSFVSADTIPYTTLGDDVISGLEKQAASLGNFLSWIMDNFGTFMGLTAACMLGALGLYLAIRLVPARSRTKTQYRDNKKKRKSK